MLLLIKITKSFGLYYCRCRIAEEKKKKENLCRETTKAHSCTFGLFLLSCLSESSRETLKVFNESYENHLIRQKVASTGVRLVKGVYNTSK